MSDQQEAFDERAAIIQFSSGLPTMTREQAEKLAAEQMGCFLTGSRLAPGATGSLPKTKTPPQKYGRQTVKMGNGQRP